MGLIVAVIVIVFLIIASRSGPRRSRSSSRTLSDRRPWIQNSAEPRPPSAPSHRTKRAIDAPVFIIHPAAQPVPSAGQAESPEAKDLPTSEAVPSAPPAPGDDRAPGLYFEAAPKASITASDDVDEDYEAFVAAMWHSPEAIDACVTLERVTYDGRATASELHSLVPRWDGDYYVNTVEGRGRKTYVAGRYKWRRAGQPIDSSAFKAIRAGVSPERALRWVPYPQSAAEALAPENNHVGAIGRAFVIGYRDSRGETSYRVVSGVRRSADGFSAHCHFRWGELRHFLYARLLSAADANDGEVIPVEVFADRHHPLGGGKSTSSRPERGDGAPATQSR
jgi:hypothetical protein